MPGALTALGLLGGLGARARRGFGSLTLLSIRHTDRETWLDLGNMLVHYSLGRGKKREEGEKVQKPDGRRDTDADLGKKTYLGRRKDGTLWEKVILWFGYKIHLIVDAVYKLSVGFTVGQVRIMV